MNEYTASNGISVRREQTGEIEYTDPSPDGYTDLIYEDAAQALREFFRAEEDERLGRWRWPGDNRFVVYPWHNEDDINPRVAIVDEATGGQASTTRATCGGSDEWAKAARAYFDAHPEPEPWQTAKPGEVWLLTCDDEILGGAYVAGDHTFITADHGMPIDSDQITSGRRIWPEEAPHE